jgi:hypothetical protein
MAPPRHTAATPPGLPTTTTSEAVPRSTTAVIASARSSDTPGSTSTAGSTSTPGDTTTTTTVTSATLGSGVGTAPDQPSDRTTEQGYLEPPDNTSAVYPFSADGPTQVSVTWPSAATLNLTVTCPDGTATGEGAASVTVTAPGTAGLCQATLAEPESESATVSYSVTIGPVAGG